MKTYQVTFNCSEDGLQPTWTKTRFCVAKDFDAAYELAKKVIEQDPEIDELKDLVEIGVGL